jgi:hypothetical protein
MNASRRKTLVTLTMAVIILVPSMMGFGAKLVEFIHTFRGQRDGVFAITPMINYLLATLGFLCMLIWATLNGMFRDMERPKETMLEQERQLDRDSALRGK